MNRAHLEFLASPDWARLLETDLLPWIEGVADLGDDVLEVGPGPGLTTDLLRRRTRRLTAVEIDPALAGALARRVAGTNVDVIHGDAADTGLPTGRFTAATCFSMLHHVPSTAAQDRVLAEIHRVLRPGAVFVATDARDLEMLRSFHEDDVFVPLDEGTIAARLQAAGFADVEVDVGDYELRIVARSGAGRSGDEVARPSPRSGRRSFPRSRGDSGRPPTPMTSGTTERQQSPHGTSTAGASCGRRPEQAHARTYPRATVRARMPRVARNAPSDSTGNTPASFHTGSMSDQS
jgi:SAM-dependent methyltransferase